MPQLDPAWFVSQIFWLAVSFGLLYFLLSRVILPPIGGIIGKRNGAIQGDIEAASNAKSMAEQAKHDYEHTLAQSREMAQALMNEVAAENKAHTESALHTMDEEIARQLQESVRRITARKLELVSALTPAAAEFAAMIAEKITLKPVSIEQASSKVIDMLKHKGAS